MTQKEAGFKPGLFSFVDFRNMGLKQDLFIQKINHHLS